MTKSENQRFRLRSKIGVAFAQRKSCWRSQQSASRQREGQYLAISLGLVSRLHSCATVSDSTANEGLLSAQACTLSQASWSRQQVFGTPCVLALAGSKLCCCTNWILQMTVVLFCHECRPRQGIGSYVSCVPHSCQVKAVSLALFCLYSAVNFINQSRALQWFSAAVSPHTDRCTGWLAVPVRTGATVQRSAHSTVANLNTSSPGSQLITQAVCFTNGRIPSALHM